MIEYGFFRFVIALVSILPWKIVEFFAFGTSVFFLIFPYRKSTIDANLIRCFPHFSEQEISKIRKKYYQFLSRLFWETLKGYSVPHQQAKKRFFFKNPEVVQQFLNANKSVIGLAAHYGNWELGALSSGLFFHRVIGLYKPIKNQRINRFVRQKRGQFGLQLGAIEHTHRIFAKNQNPAHLFLLVADQQPSNREKAIWVDFFGQETPCLHGAEMYGQRFNMPVVFIDIIPKSFGKYEAHFIPISEDASSLQPGELTQTFMSQVENRIRIHPEHWLWSHRRWKWNKNK